MPAVNEPKQEISLGYSANITPMSRVTSNVRSAAAPKHISIARANFRRGIRFGYYKKDRSGKLKHGHGPGGAPVLNKDMLLELLRQLGKHRVISGDELRSIAADLRDKDAE